MRRGSTVFWLIVLLVIAALEYYTYTSVRFAIKDLRPLYKNSLFGLYLVLTILWFGVFVAFPYIRTIEGNKMLINITTSFFMGFLILKLLVGVFLALDDLKRVLFWASSFFFTKEDMPSIVSNGMSRSEFIQKTGLLFGGALFGTFIYGMSNRYRYNVKQVEIGFANLPKAFKGLRIVHISDIHSGSFNNEVAVQRGVDLINQQNPDIIFFTGDLVNNRSAEMEGYIQVFKQLKARMGVYSIFGNHDYGDYVEWESPEAKEKNLAYLKQIHKALGWRLLLNENEVLELDGDQIALIGVENTSAKGFHSYGDLARAYNGVGHLPFKILLSHDPSHWDGQVRPEYGDIDLMLSGHTHGMQFGIDLSWLKWSPVQYMYKQWAGLYQEGTQYLYVNRGFGFLGYPGRVGMLPEITVLKLT